jgi:lipoprotein-anchoring transpeptidase ErfK/SrfK
MLHRILPALAVIVLILFGLFQIQPIKRDILYKLGMSGDQPDGNKVNELSKTGDFDETANLAIFNGAPIDYPKTSLAYNNDSSQPVYPSGEKVLGTTTASGAEKWIEVDLTTQTLRAWEGNKNVMEFPISSGLYFATPTGTFNIWYKVRYTRMTGGSKELGTYYDLPNVPDDLFFYQGYGLHGAYWHNNFGHPMSHGCVNEPLANAHQIFEWAGPNLPDGQNAVKATPDNPGTRVYIHFD